MSSVIAPPAPRLRPERWERRAQKRWLKRRDAVSGRLAELCAIEGLLDQAADVVSAGWVQGAWFTVATAEGSRAVTGHDVGLASDRPVTGACLVGAVVQAAGGPATVRSQLVQRTLDLVRHALKEEADRPVRWCPGPRLRMLGVLELTHWNDAPGRTKSEVVDLLAVARQTAEMERHRCRAEQAGLDARHQLV